MCMARNDLIFLHSTPKNQTLMEVHIMCASATLKRCAPQVEDVAEAACGLLISVMGVGSMSLSDLGKHFREG